MNKTNQMIHAHLIGTPIPIFYIKTIPALPFGSLKENETKIQKSENDRLSFSWNNFNGITVHVK